MEMAVEEPRDSGRRAGALALFLVVVALDLALVWSARDLADVLGEDGTLDRGQAIGGLATGALGLTLTWLRPRNPIGWLVSASGLALIACEAGQLYGARALLLPEEGLPLGTWALSLSAPLWIGAVFIPVSHLLVRYPTGRIEGRWPRRFDRTVAVGFASMYVGYTTSINSVTDQVPGHEPPLLLPEAVGGPLMLTGITLIVAGSSAIIGDAVRRTVRSEPGHRAALVLLLVTATTASTLIFFGPNESGGTLVYVLTLIAITVGVLRYQALGIEVVAQRTLVYALLTGLVLVVFVGLTTVLAGLVPAGPTPQILAATLIAVGLTPARERLQRVVARVMYGERDDPALTLRRLGDSMGAAPAEGLLLAVVANLSEAMHLDGARVVATDGSVTATWGDPSNAVQVPLTFAGQDLGVLEVGRRSWEGRLGRADVQLLETVTPLIAAVVHAVDLSDDLRAERNRVVEATLAERRRLRQELHDGLGPSLTGIGLGLEAVQSSAASGARSEDLVARLRTEVASSLEEIRRIIDDLRPGSLDRDGLLGALRQRVASATAAGVDTRLEAPVRLPSLRPDVEVAALRIVDEALTNVLRHAGATSCAVAVEVSGNHLRVTIADDGVGLPADPRLGVGLTSMKERAERLGGDLVYDRSGPGLRVVVTLPLADLVAR